MKVALWLYLFLFVAFFDLHAQYPMLSPFALSLGATPSFIGLILGVYSITHLPGNIIAGFGVDKYGSKVFIVCSLILAGVVLIIQSYVTNPWQLLIIRSISGFVLAFLSPACHALLAKMARDRIQQGKLMAGNGLVHTIASVMSPAAGTFLVAKLGFSTSFFILGWLLIMTGILAIVGVKEMKDVFIQEKLAREYGVPVQSALPDKGYFHIPWLFYGVPLAIACSQGILYFELPLMEISKQSIMTSGILFSLVSLGSLVTLSMLFLNRLSSFFRLLIGTLSLALIFFGMAVDWKVPLYVTLFLIGMTKGVIFPAMSTFLATITSSGRYGRVFSILSVCSSLGAFFGPILAGNLRTNLSPYFIAFVGLMLALTILPFNKFRALAAASSS